MNFPQSPLETGWDTQKHICSKFRVFKVSCEESQGEVGDIGCDIFVRCNLGAAVLFHASIILIKITDILKLNCRRGVRCGVGGDVDFT